MREQREEILMTGRPPAPSKQKSAEREGCGQRYGTEERAKEDGRGGGRAGGADMMVDLCLTITGEEKAGRGRGGMTQREEGQNRAVNEGHGEGKSRRMKRDHFVTM